MAHGISAGALVASPLMEYQGRKKMLTGSYAGMVSIHKKTFLTLRFDVQHVSGKRKRLAESFRCQAF